MDKKECPFCHSVMSEQKITDKHTFYGIPAYININNTIKPTVFPKTKLFICSNCKYLAQFYDNEFDTKSAN